MAADLTPANTANINNDNTGIPSDTIPTPFPISHIAGRYLLFDVNVISYARRTHNILGVLVGTIPNLSQQNVFLGIPLELQPEEARVLVEQGHAFVVDDAAVHRAEMLGMSRETRLAFLRGLDAKGTELAKLAMGQAEARAEKALRERGLLGKIKTKGKGKQGPGAAVEETGDDASSSSLFDSRQSQATEHIAVKKVEPILITPTTSYPPLVPPTPPTTTTRHLPDAPKSYPLFRYLHSKGYFMMPGLRFGCHYSVYPGDTLRFHSHYLATGLEYDEEFDLMDVIGGGRLANRVKKAYLIGGEVKEGEKGGEGDVAPVRAFSIEWAGL